MKNKGFSLVELSVVLTIIGLTLGSALTLATKKTEADKIEETNEKMDIIEQAINLHLINKQRIPCPSDASLDYSEVKWASEQTPSTGGCATVNYSSGNVYAGGFPAFNQSIAGENPYHALPIDIGKDGWGRHFTYAVDYRFANNSITNPACDSDVGDICFKFIDSGSITINDASGNPITTEAVYVLISHGRNGKGAWAGDNYWAAATELAAPTDSDELENAGDDEGAFDTTFVQKDETSTFDDIVRYRTKSQLLEDINAITDDGICAAALYEVDNPGDAAATCTGIADPTACQNLAAKVNELCLDGA